MIRSRFCKWTTPAVLPSVTEMVPGQARLRPWLISVRLLLMTRIQSSGLSTSICKASRLSLLDKRHGLVHGVPAKKHHPYYSSFVASHCIGLSVRLEHNAPGSAPNRPYNPGRYPRAWPGQAGLVGLALAPSGLGKRDAGIRRNRI
jgi:hypothetical protein